MFSKAEISLFVDKVPYNQSYGFSSSQVWMWELDCKEGWTPKNWCYQIAVLEKTLVNPLDSKEIKLVIPNGNQSWILIERADAKAEAPIPRCKRWLIGKGPDAGKNWEQECGGWHKLKWLDCITDSMDMSLRNSGR